MSNSYIINTDGGSRGNPGNAATGAVIKLVSGELVYEHARFMGIATNNEAEYQAVIDALNWLKDEKIKPEEIEWRLDSKLVVEQVSKRWKIKEARLQTLASQIWDLKNQVGGSHTFTYVPRAQNAHADALVNKALDAVSS